MKNTKEKASLYFSSVATVVFFIPFFLNPSISSDWDSYAIIGTYLNYVENNLYIPSRPPGFPLYELLIGICAKISQVFSFSMEQIILISQLLLTLSLNLLIYKFFNIQSSSNYFIYLIAVLSPIFLISGFTTIDYVLGSLFGFLSIYITMYTKNKEYLIALMLSLSIATRLSNVIFLVVILLFLRKDYQKAFKVGFYSTILFSIFYFIFYNNLYDFYISNNIYSGWSEFLCIFNLTNTNHDLYNRIGRFVLKQIPFLGTVGAALFALTVPKLQLNVKNNNFYFLLLFILFQLSFLRLPTEEGHLLPAFIAFAIFISQNKNRIFMIIFFFVLSSNFINLKFFEVDSIDSASSISFTLDVQKGYLIQDYELRTTIAENKEFHYNNSKRTIYNAWSMGCPNR
jgi:hypothetical protein